jgi:hypothetical protein
MKPTIVLALLVATQGCSSSGTPFADVATSDQTITRANGTVSAWRPLAALPVPRANHCSAVVNGYLIVVGGNYKSGADFVKTDTVHAAKIQPDGSLGAWLEAGRTTSPVTECVAASDGEHLFLVDGFYDIDADKSQVWVATVGSDGKLGTFASWAKLPEGRWAHSGRAWVQDGELTVISPDLGDPGAILVLRAPLGDGTPDAWRTDTVLSRFLGRAQYAAEGGRLWILGGYYSGAGSVSVETFVSSKAAGGAYGKAVATTNLPDPYTFGDAVAVDGWVFLVGGRSQAGGGEASKHVLAAKADDTGKLGAWKGTALMPQGRTNFAVAVGGDYLYVTGGAESGPGDDLVFVARIKF